MGIVGSSLSSAVTTSYRKLSSRSFGSSSSLITKATALSTHQQPLPLLAPGPVPSTGLVDTIPVGSTTAATSIQIHCVNPPDALTESASAQLLSPLEPPQLVDTTAIVGGTAPAPIAILYADPPIAMTESTATAPMEVQSVNLLTGIIDPPPDESKRITELAQPVSVAALALTLLINAPQPQSVLLVYNAYLVSLCLSLFTSIGLSMYSIFKSPPSQDFPWFQKRVMIISIGFILISIMLRLLLMLSATNMGYDMLSIVAIVAGIILYLWYSWRKANNSSQAAARSEISSQ